MKEGINFLKNNKELDLFYFSIAMQIYEHNKDISFENVYLEIEKDIELIFDKLSLSLYNVEKMQDVEPDMFVSSFRKIDKKTKKLYLDFLNSFKENKNISFNLMSNLIKIPLIKNIFMLKKYGYKKYKGEKRRTELNCNIFSNYLNNISYSNLVKDMSRAKIWTNIAHEYNDLLCRWFDNFGQINDKKITIKHIFLKGNNKYDFNNLANIINDYPFDLKSIKMKLESIQNNNFEFKNNDINLKETPNSTIAEYFVNLYYAITNNIKPNEFKNFSRTILKFNTLLPSSCAPGRGPDMFHIQNKRKLRIIETTIHRTYKNTRNNECFNLVDHVNLDDISYIPKKEIAKINKTEIFLICPLQKQEELDELNNNLSYLHNDFNVNCGNERTSKVLNFKQLIENNFN